MADAKVVVRSGRGSPDADAGADEVAASSITCCIRAEVSAVIIDMLAAPS